jgi:hypothetical protein
VKLAGHGGLKKKTVVALARLLARQFSFRSERGCVLPTRRSMTAETPAVRCVRVLRLVLRTQPC